MEPENTEIPLYSSISPVVIRKCKAAQKVRAFAFNKQLSELATLSVNGFVHVWNVERFKQVCSSYEFMSLKEFIEIQVHCACVVAENI